MLQPHATRGPGTGPSRTPGSPKMVTPAGGAGTRCWEGMGNWLPGCYPGEQWGEDFLGEDEPSDGHEASSNTPIEYLAPGVVQQVDPVIRPEGKFMRTNQGWACTIALPKGQFRGTWVCRCEDSNGRGTFRIAAGTQGQPMHLQTCLLPGQCLNWSLSSRVHPSYPRPTRKLDKWLIQKAAVAAYPAVRQGSWSLWGPGATETVQKRPRS